MHTKPSIRSRMQGGLRKLLQIFAVVLLAALIVMVWRTRKNPAAEMAVRGEEVYSSHDCTDCHLPAHVLNQKRDKKEAGLIRVRRDMDLLTKFLLADTRHPSFVMMAESDRKDLIEYLRSLNFPHP